MHLSKAKRLKALKRRNDPQFPKAICIIIHVPKSPVVVSSLRPVYIYKYNIHIYILYYIGRGDKQSLAAARLRLYVYIGTRLCTLYYYNISYGQKFFPTAAATLQCIYSVYSCG